MRIFGNLFRTRRTLDELSPQEEAVAEAAEDLGNAWPPTARRLFQVPFLPRPSSVIAHLEEAFPPILAMHREHDLAAELSPTTDDLFHRKLQFYAVGLEAMLFLIPPEEIPPREGVFSAFCHLVQEHLASCPYLLRHGAIQAYLDIVSRDLAACRIEALAAEGVRLRQGIDAALEAIHRPRLADQGDPGELTRERIFEVLLEECYRDGEYSEEEGAALEGVARLLDIGSARQAEMAAAVEVRYQARELAPGGHMDPRGFLLRLRQEAAADGVVTEGESARLRAIAHFLRLEED